MPPDEFANAQRVRPDGTLDERLEVGDVIWAWHIVTSPLEQLPIGWQRSPLAEWYFKTHTRTDDTGRYLYWASIGWTVGVLVGVFVGVVLCLYIGGGR